MALALIPSWQFSGDPAVNININPHLQMPAGMTQTTVQPIAGSIVASGDAQLGTPMARYLPKAVGVPGLGFFNTVWWQQRKWLALGLVGLLGVGGLLVAGKVLR